MHRTIARLTTTVAIAATSASLSAQASTNRGADRAARFDEADREAQSVVWVLECAQRSAQARGQGAFGVADSIGPYGLCVRIGRTRHGVFLDADTAFTRASNVRVVDLGTMVRATVPVDTAALLVELKAKRKAVRTGAPQFATERRPFAPFSYRTEDGRVHVWLIPIGVLQGQALGGERWSVFAPDGETVVESHDAAAQWRTLTLPPTGPLRVTSTEPDIPLLSEFLLANLAARGQRVTTIVTGTHESTLAGNSWMQVVVRPK